MSWGGWESIRRAFLTCCFLTFISITPARQGVSQRRSISFNGRNTSTLLHPTGSRAAGYIRKDFDRPGLRWHFLEGTATDHYDLFGDGTVKMIFTPGHSPGHQSFLINLPKSGPILLTIDAAYTLDHWNEKALPGFLASTVDTVRSVRKLHQVARQTGAMIVTGHDPDAWPKFKKTPQYYE